MDGDIHNDLEATLVSLRIILGCFSEYKAFCYLRLRFEEGLGTSVSLMGIRLIAKALRLARIHRVALEFSPFYIDEFVNHAVRAIYLTTNKRTEIIINDRPRAHFVHLCFQLQKNDKEFELCQLPISNSEDEPMSLFGASLCGNTRLQTMLVCLVTELTEDVILALAEGIGRSRLTNLSFSNCSDFDMKDQVLKILFQDIIIRKERGARNFLMRRERTVSTASKMHETSDSLPFDDNAKLSVLSINDRYDLRSSINCPPHQPGQPVLRGDDFVVMDRTCYLSSLSITKCGLDDDDMRTLSAGIRFHRHLASSLLELHARENRIGDAGVAAFIENWPEGSQLQYLNLSSNLIGPIGSTQLIAALAVGHHRNLKILSLCQNINIGIRGYMMIAEQLANLTTKSLTTMDFRHCTLYTDNRGHFASEGLLVAQSMLRAIQANYYLPEVFFDSLGADREKTRAWQDFLFYSHLNKYGRDLLFGANPNDVPPAIWSLILAKCGSDRRMSKYHRLSIVFSFLVEQPHLMMMVNQPPPKVKNKWLVSLRRRMFRQKVDTAKKMRK